MAILRQDKGRPNVMARGDNTIAPLVVPTARLRAARRFAAACLAILALLILTPARAPAQERPVVTAPAVAAPVLAQHGMVASQEARATRIGVDILQKGGNAVDAAVAIAFALAVTHPQAGNLGGGGFMLVHRVDRQETVAIDYRETAPQAVNRDTFLDAKGNADPQKSRDSALAVGVPGTVAGLSLAHERYGSGRFTLAELIEPALTLARNGFALDDDLADQLPRAQARLARWPSTRPIFFRSDGLTLGAGDLLVQADLAASLDRIARDGARAFYEGPIGEKIVASLRAAGGVMTMDDLKAYRPTVRAPLRGTYRGYDVASMPPPSAGGTLLIEMLNILAGYDLAAMETGEAAHRMMEAARLAYADRAVFLGDPAVVSVPLDLLTDKAYAARLRAGIGERARPSWSIRPGAIPREGQNTTHFSVIDSAGNAVANTYTLNFNFGLGLVADGTGILLNNELDDFSAKPGVPNAFGLVGGAANAPGPGKRPLSSMTPTILFRDGKVALVTGSPGGSRIITTVLQVIVDVIDRRKNILDAVAAPRIHHQWLPDEVSSERAVPLELRRALEARGHVVTVREPWGSANSIQVTPEGLAGAADPRTRGALAAGY
jgi:gamma-glutamyltranspeptidase/glutathione hydrolase